MIFNKKVVGIFLTIAIFASVGLAVFIYFYHPSPKLVINFLDVGQGDGSFIKTPFGQNIIIDGGDGQKILPELGRVLPFYDRTIDLMILTHPHEDHIGGLVKILGRYRVQKILATGVAHNTPTYLAWLEAVKRKNIPLVIIDRPQEINLGPDLKMEILWPQASLLNQEIDNLNNSSIVLELIYQEQKFLFMGDAENALTPSLLSQGERGLSETDVLKVAHHGSDDATSEEFLQIVKPKTAVISVGKDNTFGHPSLRTIKRLEKLGAEVYRTDNNGWVKIISDGVNLDIKTAK
ncbi:MBL fold metallo-hydrolase [Candidatus Falkowbacteria bacterium CG10_big_fil_rev_8_21_14_0_10_44_15]|uniref:MBL fold metallo-hydrolase n=1 Tax=Candidatus Falkowbacteria bacterium CG10_big_fil_rev_8_21_14_0_10_44_15 TaxID=1974569 RepID=A0A2H0UYL0_9BACT|nr:MAG: MBL fold metallo-hydrolase [Candidatus Falkowbacteria bacterium CG10_big_fil_rev_8_21_14_0_10_44_15]